NFSEHVASAFRRKMVPIGVSLILAATAAAQTPDRAQAEARARRAADRLVALQKESEALAKQERTLLVELRKLEIEREIRVEELAKIQRDTEYVRAKLGAATVRAQQLQGEAEKQRPDVEARMVQLYKMGRAGYWRLLLDVNNLRELGRAYRTAAALGRIDRDRMEEHRRTVAALATERTNLQTRAKELAALGKKAEAARAAADRAVAARAQLVASIDERRDLNAQLTGELQEAQHKLQATLVAAAAGKPVSATALPLRPFQGALPWPAEGVLSSPFGRQPPRSAGPPMRNGIELSLPEGQPVQAIHEGTVAYADLFTGYANLVIIEHGDKSYSLYGHLSGLSVKKGDRVDAGTPVGLAGRNPAGNPSLYFELRVDGKPVDPLQWLKR
ncbi:MAG TPA: peptidoglycan DD-metalloendopeptidase family protein, partial [Vicinamibacterales bacterium]|nr:peptidoglycan DD-metalloendopeptidase family protein [Vicinamibacterales bacterium]